MIFKKQARQADRKAHPLIGFLLLLIALFLLLLTGPIGFLFGLLHHLIRRGLKGMGEYALKIAISVDQLGNVIMQQLLNVLWIRPGGYRFGNRDETISSALGRNKQLGTLSGFGRWIDRFLDVLDPNHSLNSIDYYIEPRDLEQRLYLYTTREGRVLLTRYHDHGGWELPWTARIPVAADALMLAQALEGLGIGTSSPGAFRYLKTLKQKPPKNRELQLTVYALPKADVTVSEAGPYPLRWWDPSQDLELEAVTAQLLKDLDDTAHLGTDRAQK